MNRLSNVDFRGQYTFKVYALLFLSVVVLERYGLYPDFKGCEGTLNPTFYNTNAIRIGFILLPLGLHLWIYGKKIGLCSALTDISILLFALCFVAVPEYQGVYLTLALLGSVAFSKTAKKVALFGLGAIAFSVGFALMAMLTPYPFTVVLLALAASITLKKIRWQAISGSLALLLLFASIPNSLGASACRPRQMIQANMHTFQTMVEIYAVDHNGVYPQSSQELFEEAFSKDYWKDFKNPNTGTSGYDQSFSDLGADKPQEKTATHSYRVDFLGIRFVEQLNAHPKGKVLYKRISPSQYAIYGEQINSSQLLSSGTTKTPFVLTNAYVVE